MSKSKCFKKPIFEIGEKFSGRNSLLKVLKVVKPVLKLMRKQRTNVVTPSACNYDIVETFQNDLNESELFQLDFKFFDSDEAEENLRNEQLERRLLEKLESEAKSNRAFPVNCLWTPSSDVDICERGDDYVTCRQTPERQIPLPAPAPAPSPIPVPVPVPVL